MIMADSSTHNKRLKASDLARRSSDDFRENYGHSELDSIAPFQRDEIILGRRVGAGSFSSVYDIQEGGPALNIVMKLMAVLSLVFADIFYATNGGAGVFQL